MYDRRNNLVDRMAGERANKRWLERKLAQNALGIVTAMREGRMTAHEAWYELFNLDNYNAVKRRRLNPNLKEMFVWGMELDDVEELVPHAIDESLDGIEELALKLIDDTSLATLRAAG